MDRELTVNSKYANVSEVAIVLGVTLALLCDVVFAQGAAGNVEWGSYGGDLGNTRYSLLDQINGANFKDLEVAWRFKTDNLGPRPEYNFQSTPLMKNGVLYSTGGSRRAVFALNAKTGELLWVYGYDDGKRLEFAPRQLSGRGLSYWSDGKTERIIYVTPGYRMIALDAKTGRPVAGFGNDGIVDLKTDFDQEITNLDTADVGLHATPLVVGDTVIVGAAHSSGANPVAKENVKGYVRAFDARTGKRLWTFHTIPKKGEFGYDSWLDGSAEFTGNTGVWAQTAADPELGLVYLPVEMPTGDYYGGTHPGNNLFAESIVAVDLKTGQRKWHYQLVHHGHWDYDVPSPPILIDAVKAGKVVKAIAQPTKQGFLFVLDRATGKPVWPIPEVKVPKGDVPGEWYSPTQPYPSIAYSRLGISKNDLIDFTPELRAEAEKVIAKYKIGPMYTPPVVSQENGPLGILISAAASIWQGGSADPENNLVFVTASHGVMGVGLITQGERTMPYGLGSALTRNRPLPSGIRGSAEMQRASAPDGGGGDTRVGNTSVRGLPLLKPPYGSIYAIDLKEGKILWTVPNGETPDSVKNNPALKGVTIPKTGRDGAPGSLATKSILIVGEPGYGPTPGGRRGSMLRAYDKKTGAELGAVYLPAPQSGSPMTYSLDGRQYLVVAISGAGYPGELVAFALPK